MTSLKIEGVPHCKFSRVVIAGRQLERKKEKTTGQEIGSIGRSKASP
jgi:hypothetical protein